MRDGSMRKIKDFKTDNYRHSEFLQTLSTKEQIFSKLFLKKEVKKLEQNNS